MSIWEVNTGGEYTGGEYVGGEDVSIGGEYSR